MRTYGQYCPIARAAEILAERWTPIIVRNLLLGCTTFTEILEGAPGLSRTLLSRRLRELERAGVVDVAANPAGPGHRYTLTTAGEELLDVCVAMGNWGARWLDLAPEHLEPLVVLWSLCNYLRTDRLPDRRIVIRFDFTGQRPQRLWLLIEHRHGEVCKKHPGFDEDLVVTADTDAFVRWHFGQLSWSAAIRDDRIHVDGPTTLTRAFPSWNDRSRFAGITPARDA